MNRISFLRSLLGLPALPVALAAARPEQRKVYIHYGFVRGLAHYQAGPLLAQGLLAPGLAVQLVREPENPYDPEAVALHVLGHKIGFLPCEENRTVSLLLDAGQPALAAEITHVNAEAKSWQQVTVGVFMLQDAALPLPANALTQVPEPEYDGLYSRTGSGGWPARESAYDQYAYEEEEEEEEEDELNLYWEGHETLGEDEVAARVLGEFRRICPDTEFAHGRKHFVLVDRSRLDARSLRDLLHNADQSADALSASIGEAEQYITLRSDKLYQYIDRIEEFVTQTDALGNDFIELVLRKA